MRSCLGHAIRSTRYAPCFSNLYRMASTLETRWNRARVRSNGSTKNYTYGGRFVVRRAEKLRRGRPSESGFVRRLHHHYVLSALLLFNRPSPECRQKIQMISKTSERNSAVSGFLSSGGRTLARRPFSRKSVKLQKTRRSAMVMGTRYGSKSTYGVMLMRSRATN